MEYLFSILREGAGLTASLRIDGGPARPLPPPALDAADEVEIKGWRYPLATLVAALVRYDRNELRLAFDERGQLELGRYLYRQLFGQADGRPEGRPTGTPAGAGSAVRLRIHINDEQIARLPWPLPADDAGFRTPAGWSVLVTGREEGVAVEIPPAPRLLVVAPQPAGLPETRAEEHLEALEELLSAREPLLRRGRQMVVVEGWEGFREQCASFPPELVYYYGHGEARGLEQSRLFLGVLLKDHQDLQEVAER